MWIDDLIVRINAKVRWRISHKITLLIAVMLFSLVVTGSLSIYALSTANHQFRQTLDTNIQRSIIAAGMNDDLMRYDRLVVEHIRAFYRADRTKIEAELAKINAHFNTAISELKQLQPDSTNDAIQEDLEPSWQEYERTIQRILAKSRAGRVEEAMELWDGWASVRYRDIKYLIKQVINYNVELAQVSKNKANLRFERTRLRIIVLIVFITFLSVFLGVLIVRYLQISLRNLILANERVSQGNLSEGLDMALSHSPGDELGELAESNRRVMECIKLMVDDVAALTEKFLVPDQSGEMPEDDHEFSNLIDMTRTSALVRSLTQSLEQVKGEVEQVCKSDLVNPGLNEAHRRTLATIDDFNKELQKLGFFLDSLITLPERLNGLARYGTIDNMTSGVWIAGMIGRLRSVTAQIINTMEIVKFGLLDQKMRLDSKNTPTDCAGATNYFAILAKAIKGIVKRAEAIILTAQSLEGTLEKAAADLRDAPPDGRPQETGQAPPELNEYQLLLARLERIMAGFTGKAPGSWQ